MNYDEIDTDKIINEVSAAVIQGNFRKATKKESMEVRLAALSRHFFIFYIYFFYEYAFLWG